MSLTPEDLAYMRGVQAEFRPTTATLTRRLEQADGMGGRTWVDAAPVQVAVRLDSTGDEVPPILAARYDGGTLVKAVLPYDVAVSSGDHLAVGTQRLEVVSDGTPDAWQTAQAVWVREV